MINTDNLNIGDTVYADFGRYGRFDLRIGKIVNISQTRVIRVDFLAGSSCSFKSNN